MIVADFAEVTLSTTSFARDRDMLETLSGIFEDEVVELSRLDIQKILEHRKFKLTALIEPKIFRKDERLRKLKHSIP